jgi:hypothetical protein
MSLLFLILFSFYEIIGSKAIKITAVSIFRPEDSEMHKYSAILATTEPYRFRCDEQIKDSIGILRYFLLKLNGVL